MIRNINTMVPGTITGTFTIAVFIAMHSGHELPCRCW